MRVQRIDLPLPPPPPEVEYNLRLSEAEALALYRHFDQWAEMSPIGREVREAFRNAGMR
jgi:hypothetical protein